MGEMIAGIIKGVLDAFKIISGWVSKTPTEDIRAGKDDFNEEFDKFKARRNGQKKKASKK